MATADEIARIEELLQTRGSMRPGAAFNQAFTQERMGAPGGRYGYLTGELGQVTGARRPTQDMFEERLRERLRGLQRIRGIEEEEERVQQAREQLYGDADALMQAAQVTPDDEMINQLMRQRISGEDLPFGAQQRAAYMARAGDAAAAGQEADVARIQGNPADPAYQAQANQARRERLRRQQQARTGFDMQAGAANYAARGQAAAGLAGQRQQQFGRQAAATQYRGNLLSREESTTDPTGKKKIRRSLPRVGGMGG